MDAVPPQYWTVIAPLITAVIAVLAFLVGQWQHGRLESAQQISKEVDAKIGGVLLSLRTLESEANQRLGTIRSDAERVGKDLADRAERANALARKLDELVERAERDLPSADTRHAVPAILRDRARQELESRDFAAAAGNLAAVLENPDADSEDLELAGDIAARGLQNPSLARRLYERAVEANPDNISAKAEILWLRAGRPGERDDAARQIRDLSDAHPEDRNVLIACLNVLTKLGDYKGMRTFAENLMQRTPHKSLLWRNIAVARQHLGDSRQSVLDAYRASVTASRSEESGEESFANTAAIYASYLIGSGTDDDLNEAERLIMDALRVKPTEAQLHITRAELEEKRGNYDAAGLAYEWALKLGDLQEQRAAMYGKKKIEILQALGLASRSP